MRPHPSQDREHGQHGRIIYLGDVRRRRGRRAVPDRHYLAGLVLSGAAAWAVWFTVFVTLPPARLLTYIAFFTPLAVALAASGALLAYAVEVWRGHLPGVGRAARRGTLASAVTVANLALVAAHRWTPLSAIITVAVAAILEIRLARQA